MLSDWQFGLIGCAELKVRVIRISPVGQVHQQNGLQIFGGGVLFDMVGWMGVTYLCDGWG